MDKWPRQLEDLINISEEQARRVRDFIENHIDDDRKLNPATAKANPDQIERYKDALDMTVLISAEGKAKASFDRPEEVYTFHGIYLQVSDGEFDDDRLEYFKKLISLCDGLSIDGCPNGDISFVLQFYGLYEEGRLHC